MDKVSPQSVSYNSLVFVSQSRKPAAHAGNDCGPRVLVVYQQTVFRSVSIGITCCIRYFQVVLVLHGNQQEVESHPSGLLTDTVLPVVGHLASKSVATL